MNKLKGVLAALTISAAAVGIGGGSAHASSHPVTATVHIVTAATDSFAPFCGAGYGSLAQATRTGVDEFGEPLYAYSGALTGLAQLQLAGQQNGGGAPYTGVTVNVRVGVNGAWKITKGQTTLRAAYGGGVYDLSDYIANGGDQASSIYNLNVFGALVGHPTSDDTIGNVKVCVKPQ